jgi:hypothetical protein
MRISNNVFLAYLHCPYKAHLLLRESPAARHPWDSWWAEVKAEYDSKALTALRVMSLSLPTASWPTEAELVRLRACPRIRKGRHGMRAGGNLCILQLICGLRGAATLPAK